MTADLSTWAIIAAVNRWALYALMLISVGSALFALLTPAPLTIIEIARRTARIAAPIAAVSFLLSVGFGGAEIMTGGIEMLFSFGTWSMGADTSLGRSAAIGIPSMLFLWASYTWKVPALAVVGALGGVLSFLVTGHAATAAPVWLTASAVAIHILGASYWIGALYPLYRATRDLDAMEAGAILTTFSYRAVAAVAAIVVSGIVISWVQLGELERLLSTTYGLRLTIKLALFVTLLGLAGYNKQFLTPRIVSGSREAALQLSTIIRLEYFLIVFVLAAAVSLTMTEPPRAQNKTAAIEVSHHEH